MNFRLTFCLLCLFCHQVFAQTDPQLPRFLTPQEQWDMQFTAPKQAPVSGSITTPPGKPVRAMAEWEELQALVITWRGQSAILGEIVRAARLECKVIICCNDQATVSSAKSTLTSMGVNYTTNVDFLVTPNNSIWVRDYGPNSVYAQDVDSLYIIDWIYNRPSRPLDNAVPEKIADYLNIPIYATSAAPYEMVHTGGNFMSDGMHTAFSSSLIVNENEPNNPYGTSGQTEVEINQIMQDFMGIYRYVKMEPLPYDVIHHIDMHMKLLDEETLLVGEYPEGVADGPQIEANIQYVLSNYKTVFGTPYKVIRIPMPPKNSAYPDNGGDYRTYANAVFVNKTVIVPFYETKYDTTAQRIWETALPGYKIVGIDCNSIIPSLGAIHCITKEVGVEAPLHIVHQPLSCVDNALLNTYPVYATLQHRTGINNAKVWYTTDLALPWNSVDMVKVVGDTANVWNADIPQQNAGATVYYYVEANANNGKIQRRPMPAPAGYWKFCVTETSATAEVPATTLLEVFPNPAAAITCIPVMSNKSAKGSICLFDALGKQVATIFEGTFSAGKANYFFNADTFAPGTYFIQMRTNDQTTMRKIVIR